MGLPRRVPSHPLGSSVSGGSSMVVLGDSTMRGRRSFSPSGRLELLLGRVRRQLGRPRRGNPSVRVLGFQAKKGFSINRRGMMAVQGGFLEFSSLLRGRKMLPSATVSRQSLTSGDREARGLMHQEVVQDLLRQWPAIIVLFATPLSARLSVFFATAWHSSSLGTTSGHMPSHPLPS